MSARDADFDVATAFSLTSHTVHKGQRINYVTAGMQGDTDFECELDDAATNRAARIRCVCSRGAVLMTLSGSLLGLHDAQLGVHSVMRARRTATADEHFETQQAHH